VVVIWEHHADGEVFSWHNDLLGPVAPPSRETIRSDRQSMYSESERPREDISKSMRETKNPCSFRGFL